MPHISHAATIIRPWGKLTQDNHMIEIIRFAQHAGGHAVSINLNLEFEARLLAHQNPMRAVSKSINAELNRLDLRNLPILLMLEAARPEGRLHLHGVYLSNGSSKFQIQQAMRKAVGYITGRRGSRQFHSKLMYNADGWKDYLGKDCRWTRRILDLAPQDRICWVSHPMTKIVRNNYEAVRLGRAPAANNNSPMLSTG